MKYRKRLLLDVDGVLGDFHRAGRDLIYRLFRLDLQMEDFVTWDITDVLPTKEMKDACNHGIAQPGFATNIQPFPEAREAIQEIRLMADVEILYVTTPHHISKTWMQERNEWLIHHFGASIDEIHHCFRKYAVAGDALVDDKPAHIEQWGSHHPGRHALLWNTPYNQRETHLKRVHHWNEVLALFRN